MPINSADRAMESALQGQAIQCILSSRFPGLPVGGGTFLVLTGNLGDQGRKRGLDGYRRKGRTSPGPNHQVPAGRYTVPLPTKCLTHPPFPAVPNDGISHLAGDHHPQPAMVPSIRAGDDHQHPVGGRNSILVDPGKIYLPADPIVPGKRITHHDHTRLFQ